MLGRSACEYRLGLRYAGDGSDFAIRVTELETRKRVSLVQLAGGHVWG